LIAVKVALSLRLNLESNNPFKIYKQWQLLQVVRFQHH